MYASVHILRIAFELLKNGAKMTLKDDNGSAPLLVAAIAGHLEVVKMLVDNYADIDVT